MFLFLFFGIQALGLVYLIISLRRRYQIKPLATYALSFICTLYFVMNYLAFKLRHSGSLDFRSVSSQIFYYTTYTLLTLFAFAIFYSVFLDLCEFISSFSKKIKKPIIIDENKRLFLKKSANIGLLSGVLGSSAIGIGQALSGPEYKFISIPTQHQQMKGLKIVQVSDLHVGPMIGREYVQKTVDLINAQNPDLVVLTGDLVDGTPEQLMRDMEPLSQIKSKLGVYGCLGNHELYSGLYDWLPQFEQLNIRMLNNEHTIIDSIERTFVLAGVTDPQVGRSMPEFTPDAEKAIESAPQHLYKIVLAHQPSACFDCARAGFDLQLSGHTHAGQFFPFSLLVKFAHPYVKGLNLHQENHHKMWVYVNQATGYWGPPNRFAIPAEITVLEFEDIT